MKKQNKEQENKVTDCSINEDCMTSILAHDLKTPINAVIGFSELSLESLKKFDYENIRKYLEIISKQAKIANRQISSLAEWSFYFQKNIGDLERFNISELIDLLIENHIELSDKKNIEIIKCLDFNTTEILGNIRTIEIIIRNLINNAIKFTNENGKIEILGLKKGNTIEIIVKDNGIGIEQSEIDNIFKKTEPKFGTANEKGFGIGLSLCKRIIDNLNEKIWVISKKGEGTEFHFTISQKNSNFEQNEK